MAYTPFSFSIDPGPETVVVTLRQLTDDGTIVRPYTALHGSSTVGGDTFSVTSYSTYYLREGGVYYLSLDVGGVERATEDGSLLGFHLGAGGSRLVAAPVRAYLRGAGGGGGGVVSKNYIDASDYVPSSDLASASAGLAEAAAAAIAADKMLYLPKRRYNVDSVINLFDVPGLKLIGEGPDATVFYHDATAYMLDIRGGTRNTTTTLLTVNAAAGDTSITVADASVITAGQYANLQSDQIWDATSGKDARYGELVKVVSVNTGTDVVTLAWPLDYAYLTSDSAKLNTVPLGGGIQIKGIGFENTDPLSGVGGALVLRYALNPVVEDILGDSLDGPLIQLDGCDGAQLTRVNGRDMADDEANDRYGYVVSLGPATRGSVVRQGYAVNCRHLVTTATTGNATLGGVPVHNEIIGCVGTGFTNVVFDTHEEGDDTHFVGCKVFNTLDIGFHARGPRTRWDACDVDGAKGTAFYVRATALNTIARNITAHNLRGALSARSNATNGMRILAAETVVDGFDFKTLGDSGMVIAGNRQTIRNGRIFGAGVSANPQGVRFNAASIDHVLENILVDGNGGGTGYYASGFSVTGIRAANLRSRNVSAHLNNLILETEMANNTAANDWVSKSPAERTPTATSTVMTFGDRLLAVTSTASARTITLPAISAVAPNVIYTIKDESGAAGTNNITVQRAGSDTIEGGTSKTISTNYGLVRLYSNGTEWMVA